MYRRLTAACALMMAGSLVLPAAAQLHVKVHKELVSISLPDINGTVSVLGNRGAVTFSSAPTSFYIENLVSQVRIPITLNPDGGFSTRIQAQAGQQIRILARIAGGKQSYGTFTVPVIPGSNAAPPAGLSSVKTPPATAGKVDIVADAGPAALPVILPVDPNNPLAPDLTVIITFINPQTGQVLAVHGLSAHTGLGAETPTAGPKSAALEPPLRSDRLSSQSAERLANIVKACIDAIRSELLPVLTPGSGTHTNQTGPPAAPADQTSSGTTKGGR